MGNLELCQIEYGGQGGLLRYCGSVAAQLGPPQLVVTAQSADLTYLPESTRVARVLPWGGKGGARTAMDVAFGEYLLRRGARDLFALNPVLIHIGLVLPPHGERIVHLVHDPDPRPLGGSYRLARWAVRRRLGGPGWTAQHGPEFGFDRARRALFFPLPLGPASFAPRPSSLADFFGCTLPNDAAKIFCFGRAATQAGLDTLMGALDGALSPNRKVVILAMGQQLEGSDRRHGRLRVVTKRGLVPNDLLDALVAESTAVSVPHSAFPRSASGILALAAYHGVSALLGDAVDPQLVHNASSISFRLRSSEQVQAALSRHQDEVTLGRGRTWGAEFKKLLRSADV